VNFSSSFGTKQGDLKFSTGCNGNEKFKETPNFSSVETENIARAYVHIFVFMRQL